MLNRIPDVKNSSKEAMGLWFYEMAKRNLIYHPEDSADDIIGVVDNEPFFSEGEAVKAQSIMDAFYSRFEHEVVIETCYPHFMRAAGFEP